MVKILDINIYYRLGSIMKEKQLELLNKAVTEQEEASQILLEYWKLYSNMG